MGDELTPPKATLGDDVHKVGRAAASVLLPAGGHLVDAVFSKPLEKRQDAWRDSVADMLRELLGREQVTVESLQEDPQFVDAVFYASRAATYTSSEEKREALKNAIYNTGIRRGPDDVERLVFIRLIDELTEWHLRLLKLASRVDPQGNMVYHPQLGWDHMPVVALELFPEFTNRRDYYNQLLIELENHGLVSNRNFLSIHGEMKWRCSSATTRGKALLDFITHPDIEPADT